MNYTALRKLATIAKHHNVGLPSTLKSTPILIDCSGCAVGSFQTAPHQGKLNRPIPGHTIVCDIAGPLKKTKAGYQYFLSIIELHTRYALVFLLKAKDEAPRHLQSGMTAITRNFNAAPPG